MSNLHEQIIDASNEGKLAELKRLMNQHPSQKDLSEALIRASFHGHLDLVRELLKSGASPQYRDSLAMRVAVLGQQFDVLKTLLNAGANVNAHNDFALKTSADWGLILFVEKLLSYGADYSKVNQAEVLSPEVVKLLREAPSKHAEWRKILGEIYNCQDQQFMKDFKEDTYIHLNSDEALRLAATRGCDKILKILIQYGANVHAKNDEALKFASDFGHDKVVDVLLKNDANVRADKDFALRYASMGGHLGIVKRLLEKGADVHADRDFALRMATFYKHHEVVATLIESGADVHIDNGKTLKIAVENGDLKMVKILLKSGANPDVIDSSIYVTPEISNELKKI